MCLNSEPYNLNFATLNLRALSELQCIIFLQQHMYGMSKKKKKKINGINNVFKSHQLK